MMSTVVVLTPHVVGFYGGEIVAGVIRAVEAEGGRVIVVHALGPHGLAPQRDDPFSTPVALGLADVVVSVPPARTESLLADLQRRGTPVVLAGDHAFGVEAPLVTPDNRQGVHAAVTHLMEHGHRRIGYVGPLEWPGLSERHQAWLEILAERDLPSDGLHVVSAGDSTADGAAAGRDLLASGVLDGPARPSAVVVANDHNALGLVTALAEAGVRVPTDLAVVGFDDIEPTRVGAPSLSTVHQRFDVIGIRAGRIAMRLARGEHVGNVEHRADASVLVPRGSCGCRADVIDDHTEPAPGLRSVTVRPDDLAELLHTVLDERRPDALPTEEIDRVVARVHDLLGRAGAVRTTEVVTFVRHLRQTAPDTDTLRRLVGGITEHLQRLLVSGPSSRPDLQVATRLATSLWELRSWADLEAAHARESAVMEHGDVTTALLRLPADEAPHLGWLGGSHVRSALLALWDPAPESGRLRVVGAYGRAADGYQEDEQLTVRTFPPLDFLDGADGGCAEASVVVPVRTAERDWGLLAVIGTIDRAATREVYRDWAQVLCTALEAGVLEEQLRRAALYDALTGLPNRRLFLDRLDQAVERARRDPDHACAVVFLDLDGFKLVNDSLGHAQGDELLRVVGARLQTVIRATDTAARLGGDEFAVLLSDVDPAEVPSVTERIERELTEPLRLGGEPVTVRASIGTATSADSVCDAESLLRDADVAMYAAKARRRGGPSDAAGDRVGGGV